MAGMLQMDSRASVKGQGLNSIPGSVSHALVGSESGIVSRYRNPYELE
jgi:hypothetical protein